MEIVIKNLSKNYGRKAALKNVSVTIHSGMYGLLGRNGAGKTSLMRILATLSVPSGGEVSMNGIPINETGKIREIVGYLSQNFSFYRNMSVYDAMDYLGLLSNLPDKIRKERIALLLEQVNLKENMRTKIKALSGGMKQRLGIAQALLHDPQILIVDEPTAGRARTCISCSNWLRRMRAARDSVHRVWNISRFQNQSSTARAS